MRPCAFREDIQRMVNNLTPFGIFCILDISVFFCLLLAQSRIPWQLHKNTLCTSLQDARAMKFGLLTDKAPPSLLKYKLVTTSQTVLF